MHTIVTTKCTTSLASVCPIYFPDVVMVVSIAVLPLNKDTTIPGIASKIKLPFILSCSAILPWWVEASTTPPQLALDLALPLALPLASRPELGTETMAEADICKFSGTVAHSHSHTHDHSTGNLSHSHDHAIEHGHTHEHLEHAGRKGVSPHNRLV